MANNLIQIKRSLVTNIPASLANGELAYAANGDVLYIGSNNLVVSISGARTPGILSANQALVANSSSSINKILVANLVPTGLWANGQSGGAGNYLASDGANVYWTAPAAGVSGGTAANTQMQYNNSNTLASAIGFTYNNTTNNVVIANTLTVGTTIVNSSVIFSGNSTVNSSGNSSSDILSSTIGTSILSAVSLIINANASSLIVIGNSTVNTNINSTSFSGTANNSTSLGGTLATGYQTTAGLSSNVATLTSNNTLYLNGTLASGYQTIAGLSSNVATLTANNTLYLGGTLASGYQTTAGLSSNVATLTANNTSYLGGQLPAYYAPILNPVFTANITVSGSSVFGTYIITGNSTVNTTINATSFSGTSNNTLYLGGTLASGYQTIAGLASNVATLTTNNTLYLGGTLASGYQTTAGLSSNVITLTSNNTLNLGGQLPAYYAPIANPTFSANITVNGTGTFGSNSSTNNGILAYTNNGNSAIFGLALTSTAIQGISNTGFGGQFIATNIGGIGVVATSAFVNTYITTGNSTVNTTINATSFSGTSNNTLYLGGTLASGYQTIAGLASNVATLTANNTLYLGGVVASGYQTTAGLSSNVATLTSNNTLYLGGVVASLYALNTSVTTAYTNALADTLSFNRTYTGNNTFAGTNTVFSSNISVTSANIYAPTATLSVQTLSVSGNLTVAGTVTSLNTSQLTMADNIIELGSNNSTTDVTDIGWFSPSGNSTSTWYSGITRIAAKSTNNNPYFFMFGSNTNPNTAITIDTTANTITGSLQAYLLPYGLAGAFVANSTAVNITANATVSSALIANSITLTTALLATYGGTGVNTYATGDILYAGSANPTALTKLSVPGAAANGLILQITNNLPAYGSLDGGTF